MHMHASGIGSRLSTGKFEDNPFLANSFLKSGFGKFGVAINH